MWNLLIALNKKLVLAIPFFLVLGFLFGLVTDNHFYPLLKSAILPLTFLMVYPMMVTLNIQQLRKGINLKIQTTAQLINFFIIPAVAFVLGKLFFTNQPELALGLLLAALLPTSGMTISWTGFAKGNLGAAINLTVIGLTLGSLLSPFYLSVLLGQTIEINLLQVFRTIILIVFLPLLLGQITRALLLKRYQLQSFKTELAPRFPALSTLGVLGIVFVAMALKAQTIVSQPQILLSILIPIVLLYLINFVTSTVIARTFFTRGDGIALVYGTVMRNLSIALAISVNTFGESGTRAAIVIALAYIIQVQSAAWYVKFSDRFFGPPPASD